MEKTIFYGNSEISVSYEVAEFLESDRKRQEAEKRSDRRHISKSDSEPVLATVPSTSQPDPTLDAVIQNLTLQTGTKKDAVDFFSMDLNPHILKNRTEAR